MRLGLYGGTFDPVHEAHVQVAMAARRQFQLDQVLLIPNRIPPHKQAATSAGFEDRLRMVELACQGHPGLAASDVENLEGKSYTIQTLHRLRTQYGDEHKFFFIIGADAFAEVMLWYRVQEVFGMTDFVVVSRPGFDYEIPEGARIHRLETLNLKASSTMVRDKLARGEECEELPPQVRDYIKRKGLYGSRARVS